MTVRQIFGMDQSVISEENLELGFGSLLEGVCLGYLNECRVGPGGFVNVISVNTGLVAVGGVFVHNATATLVGCNRDPALPRYTRVVAQRNNTTNAVQIYAKEGTPAAAPVPPSLTRAGGVYEISLARVYVAPGGAALFTANEIIDERGEPALCGYMTFKAREHVLRQQVEGMRQRGSWSAGASDVAVTGEGLYTSMIIVDNASAAVQDADGMALRQDTGGVLGNEAYIYAASFLHMRSFFPAFECKFKLGQTTQERLFVGLGWIPLIFWQDDLSGNRCMGLQYSTNRGDTTFMFTTSDGAARNLVDTGVPVDTNAHILRVLADSASAIIELRDTNRNVEARLRFTTYLPPVGTMIAPISGLRTLAAAVKSIYQYYGEGINRGI